MKITTLALLFAFVLPLGANSLPSERRKNGPLIQDALRAVQTSLQESSAVFYSDENSKPFIYGTVVSADGLILTKASELEEVKGYNVRVGTAKFRTVQEIARNDVWDVVLVKVDATDLLPVNLDQGKDLAHGTWVVSNGATERRFRRPRPGIISANKREIPGGTAAVLGVGLEAKEEGVFVGSVTEKSGAEKAGLQKEDQLVKADGVEIKDRDALVEILKEKSPGDIVKFEVKRKDEVLQLDVELMARHKLFGGATSRNDQLSGGDDQQSPRREGFPMVLQHETMLNRATVGGPVFTLDNEFVGMNIAAVNRVEVFAIPAGELAAIIADLKKDL